MSASTALTQVFSSFQGEIRYAEPMSHHVSFRIGGPAGAFAVPREVEDLRELITHARERGIPMRVMGGTNILVRDGGIDGIVVSLNRFQRITPPHHGNGDEDGDLYAGGGVRMPHLLNIATRLGLGGLEFAAGIPGTVAGSVVMNAGTSMGEMQDVLRAVDLLDCDGRRRTVTSQDLTFRYRQTQLPAGVVIGAWLKVTPCSRRQVARTIQAALLKRKRTQPISLPSAGCVFRNPAGISAGRIIETAGMKGTRVGDAAVSDLHANFIVNLGRATARDVLDLIHLVRETVLKKTGVMLDLELTVVGCEQHAAGRVSR